ncbi:MAG: hypothetical protein N4A50_10955 [Vallitalea sp.]|jgi:hypothetical protein|nr:hypothetical protein [Vallitalea sp.]
MFKEKIAYIIAMIIIIALRNNNIGIYGEQKEFNYEIDNSELSVLFSDSNNRLKIKFGYGGVNSLYGIQEITYLELDSEIALKSLKSCTDWIGPYIIKDLSNKSEDIKPRFTGGWHGSDGGGSGEVTALTSDPLIYCNNKLISLAKNKTSKEIKIVVTNLIYAYNSNEPVLEETHTYIIKDREIYIDVRGNALKDIEISKYYGLQSQNSLWDGYVIYHYINNTSMEYTINESSNSMPKKDNIVKEFELLTQDRKYKLLVGLDTNYGLGKFENLKENLSTCFTSDYGKSYFNLINGKKCRMEKGEYFSWRGYYKFISETKE